MSKSNASTVPWILVVLLVIVGIVYVNVTGNDAEAQLEKAAETWVKFSEAVSRAMAT